MGPVHQGRTKMKWGPQAKLIDEALLKYDFVNISLLPIYIYLYNIQKVVKTHNITNSFFLLNNVLIL